MFKGVGTAIITPFNEDFSIDYHSLDKLIEYQISNGVDAIILLGTTGESPVIKDDERDQITKHVKEKINNRVKLIIGTGTNDPHHVIEHNNGAEKNLQAGRKSPL